MTPQIGGPAGAGASTDDGWSGRGYIRFGLVCVLVLAGGFGTWAATASLSGAVIATGQLRVETNRQVVQHLDGGVVGEIYVRDGDIVEAGEVLIKLDATLLQSELAALESQLFEIMARRGRLEAAQIDRSDVTFDQEIIDRAESDIQISNLLAGQRSLHAAKRESVAKELAVMDERKLQLEDQIIGTDAEVASLTEQSRLIGQELDDMRVLLKKNLVQAGRVLSLEREAARLQGESGRLISQIAQLRGQISQIDIEALRMDAAVREEAITELRELGFRELELKERRLSLLERLSRLEIRAPRPGTVLDMTVHAIKSVVRPAEPILYVVPSDSDLIVDARVDPLNRDQVDPRQETVLRFSGLNTRTTPELFGEVKNISRDSIVDEQTGMAYYKAEVAFREGELEKLEGEELIAGMPVEVYIQTGDRTPLNYMVKPITDYFNRAMRED
ncbi:MAG: HlyD family type I secretion periplasmic adaptor subunit [Pseudomonadota bacterium]